MLVGRVLVWEAARAGGRCCLRSRRFWKSTRFKYLLSARARPAAQRSARRAPPLAEPRPRPASTDPSPRPLSPQPAWRPISPASSAPSRTGAYPFPGVCCGRWRPGSGARPRAWAAALRADLEMVCASLPASSQRQLLVLLQSASSSGCRASLPALSLTPSRLLLGRSARAGTATAARASTSGRSTHRRSSCPTSTRTRATTPSARSRRASSRRTLTHSTRTSSCASKRARPHGWRRVASSAAASRLTPCRLLPPCHHHRLAVPRPSQRARSVRPPA